MSEKDLPGPAGVLVCAENFVIYMNEFSERVQDMAQPTRRSERQGLLVCTATHKMRNQFFVPQSTHTSDIYKVRTSERLLPAAHVCPHFNRNVIEVQR
jgi:hypothetical protein